MRIVPLLLVLLLSTPALGQTTFTVTTTADAGPGSLRQALLDANAQPNGSLADEIHFSIPGAGPHTIAPTSPLPDVTDPVVLDGYTQPGSSPNTNPFGQGLNTVLRVELNGTSAGFVSGLVITAGASTVRGLVINRFAAQAIEISQQGGTVIEGCFLNTNVAGTAGLGGGFSAIFIDNVPNNRIGGTTPAARNLMVGRSFHGIELGGGAATANRVEGNLIGTDVTGTASLGATFFGVNVFDGANNNAIGGTTPGAGNVISGNGSWGIALHLGSSNNLVQGNYIGTDAAGVAPLPNLGDGIRIETDATNNVIGGTSPAARNVISGNDGDGVEVQNPGSTGNRIEGNYIGTDRTGLAPLPNGASGVELDDTADNVVGGTVPGAGNVLSANGARGVYLVAGSKDNLVQGNHIGVDATGTAPLGNGGDGVGIENATDNLIGGTEPGAGNVISANSDDGVDFAGADANFVLGNYIGTDRTGTLDLGNADAGINVFNSRFNVLGDVPDAGNVIAFNVNASDPAGIRIAGSSTDNWILRNAFYNNVGLGIDLAGDGVTANDPGDGDDGPNRLQNYPEMATATGDGASALTIEYAVPTATANAAYPLYVEFFLADADGQEGRRFIGWDHYEAAEAEGPKTIVFMPVGEVLDGERLVATATDADGNTSEFSAPVTVVGSAVANEPSGAEGPAGFVLSAAYPNPFNPSTVLMLAVPAVGPVTVAVYDALGRQVAVLHEGPLAAGVHALRLEATGLPSGVYVVRAEAAEATVARRVTLLR